MCQHISTYQFEEVDELKGVFSGGEVNKVPWDPVAQTGTGLHCHLAGCVAESWTILNRNKGYLTLQQVP